MIETNVHPPVVVKWCCLVILIIAILKMLYHGLILYDMFTSGEGIYRDGDQFGIIMQEEITRDSHPERFSETQSRNLFYLFMSGLFAAVSGAFFYKLRD